MKDATRPQIPQRFGGPHSEAYNVMRHAMTVAANHHGYDGEYCEYDLFENAPRTSLTVSLVDAIRELGYEIVPRREPKR